VVGSLWTMQAARVRDREVRDALSESIGRVHTISLVHQAMYGAGGIDRLAFGDYLGMLAAHLGDLYGGADAEIRVQGDNPTLSLETAVPLALIVHEALANALAHAFPGGRKGVVVITVAYAPGGVRLTIEDDGAGLSADSRDGLGMRIMRTLAAQVGASLEVTSSAAGTRVAVSRANSTA
ncbi:MAG: sensor histidine kinase, partial [Pseudomonadota bacterium]